MFQTNNLIQNFKKVLLAAFIFFMSYSKGYCQPGNPDDVPIDGGISLLAAAGIGYGTKKIIDFRKKQNDKEEE